MHAALSTYSFLLGIPGELLSVIDLDVLHIPSDSEVELITKLTHDLKKNIVIYRKDHIAKGHHLCRVLRPAFLTPEQLNKVKSIEGSFGQGHVVVAYEKPLAFY